MSFRWTTLLALAEQLAKVPMQDVSSHAQLRSAISRAYYAAYHTVQQYIQDEDIRIPAAILKKGSHESLYLWLKEQSGAARVVGMNLERLHQYRVAADYKDYSGLVRGKWQEAANDSLAIAHRIVATIASLRRP